MNAAIPAPPLEATAPVAVRSRRRKRRQLLVIAGGIAALLLVLTLGGVARFWEGSEAGGLVFVIPKGTAAELEQPGIDAAIMIPTDIRFGPDDDARITIRNEDSTTNRAGPWVVMPGQTYTIGPLPPGSYFYDCTVDAKESVTVTVEG